MVRANLSIFKIMFFNELDGLHVYMHLPGRLFYIYMDFYLHFLHFSQGLVFAKKFAFTLLWLGK